MLQVVDCLKRNAVLRRGRTATVDGARRHTWDQLLDRVRRVAGALRSLDLDDDGRVAVLALNSDRYLECYFAVPWAGGIIVPVNTRWALPEIIFSLNDADAQILVVDEHFAPMVPAIREQVPTIRHVVAFTGSDAAPGLLDYERQLATATPVEDAGKGNEDVFGVFYTGGTTGRAKGVMLTHANILSNAMNFLAALGPDESAVYLHAAPMFHLADGGSSFSLSLAGGAHVFIPKFDPQATLQAFQEHRVTHGLLVPTMLKMVADHPAFQTADCSSVRSLMYGASPMPSSLIEALLEKLPHTGFVQAYGMTELSPVATFLEPQHHRSGAGGAKLASAGRPTFTVQLKIVDPADDEVPSGTVGEIVVRGPTMMKGYWKRPAETATALRGGWMHTGDAGYVDEDGFLFVVDRVKDMVISGGENIYSVEVENAIYAHAAVAACAVIAVPSPDWGESVHAVVVPKAGHDLTADQVIAHCRERIAAYKCPKSVELRTEPLPMSGAGKILKNVLREPYWKGAARRVG